MTVLPTRGVPGKQTGGFAGSAIRSIGLILTVLGLFCVPVLLAAESPSPEIQRVLKERYDGKYDLNLAGLTKTKPAPDELKKLEDKAATEIHRVPYPKGMADYFGYTIYRSKATGEIWILRSGGIAGVRELYNATPPKQKP